MFLKKKKKKKIFLFGVSVAKKKKKKKKKKNISFICGKCCNKDKKTFKEEESIEI